MSWKFCRADPLIEGRSKTTDNLGEISRIATKNKSYVNTETGEYFTTTDLAQKKYYRNKKLSRFTQTYERLFANHEISILLISVSIDKFSKPNDFYKGFARKLKGKQIMTLGFYWCRDIGDIRFKRHYHFIIATTRIPPSYFNKLFQKKKHAYYDVAFCNSLQKFKSYLAVKEIYAPLGRRSNGSSQFFKKPCNLKHVNSQENVSNT